MTRRAERTAPRRVAAVVVAGGVASLTVLAGLSLPAGGQDAGGDDRGRASGATATVERRDLLEREELDGTLGYGPSRAIAFGGQGTVTALTAEGTVVEQGGSLGEVDGRPVPLLYGERPMWRTLGQPEASPDPTAPAPEPLTDGPDIAQLETALVALGYGTAAALGPDDHWTAATTAAVKRWQADLGVARTGRLEPGSLVFLPGPVRIAAHTADLGAPSAGPALTVTGTERLVEVDLAAGRQGLLAPGQAVEVDLPDGTRVPATVRSVSTTVEPAPPNSGGNPTVAVVIVLDDPAASGSLDQAPVDVQVVSVRAEDALTVPVEALLALAEGGYAVEGPDGSLVGVDIGVFADGFVEVVATGGASLEVGDEVVVPS